MVKSGVLTVTKLVSSGIWPVIVTPTKVSVLRFILLCLFHYYNPIKIVPASLRLCQDLVCDCVTSTNIVLPALFHGFCQTRLI